MSELKAPEAVMTAVVTIKRAATGKEETYNLVFTPAPPEPEQQPKEPQ